MQHVTITICTVLLTTALSFIVSCDTIGIDPPATSEEGIRTHEQPTHKSTTALSFDVLYGTDSSVDGLYTIDLAGGTTSLIGTFAGATTPVAMAVDPSNGEIYVWTNSPQMALLRVDRCTAKSIQIGDGNQISVTIGALAFHPTNGRLYGTSRRLGLVELSTQTGAVTSLAPLPFNGSGADFDAQGTLYFAELSLGRERLGRVDVSTGGATVIGELTPDVRQIGSLLFRADGKLLGSSLSTTATIYEIDPLSAQTSNPIGLDRSPQGMGLAPACQPAVNVEVDIKPGSDPNSINRNSMGSAPVAILGSEDFDVSDIDVTTLSFGPAMASPRHDLTSPSNLAKHLKDVNKDGFADLLTHFPQKLLGLPYDATESCIDGFTIGGTPIEGCDSVNVVQ